MSKRRIMFGLVILTMTLILGWSGSSVPPVAADEGAPTPPTEQRTPMSVSNQTPPPLSGGCISGAVPIDDYDQIVCCVNGYVYLNGGAVAGATVTISANGQSVTVPTADGAGSDSPYFSASLSNEPLNVQPGDVVTVTAEVDGQSKTQTFIAQSGGQQVDVVLPQSVVEAAWQRVDIPSSRHNAMAYDAARERTVLFSGTETWEWDGTIWMQQTPLVSPPARSNHAMVYDAARERVVLFGGAGSGWYNYLTGTWEWDGTTWVKRTPPTSPGGRMYHAMVYDTARQRVVLFGGYTGAFSGTRSLNDTWEWDGTTWVQQTPEVSPVTRFEHAMAYDEARGRTVLFGGSHSGHGDQGDTWEWDGTTWVQQTPAIFPTSRYDHEMAYDAARERVVLFGGQGGGSQDTWEWNGAIWVRQTPSTSPSGSNSFTMAYHAASERIMLFGQYSNGTWEWDGSEWSRVGTTDKPATRSAPALAYEKDGQSLLFGGSTFSDDSYRWTGSGWASLTVAHKPPGRIGHQLARNGDGTELLLFGGINADSSYRNDTWLWDRNDNDWLAQTAATNPSARADYALTYDVQNGVWLLFGGNDGSTHLNDTWQYDGTTWEKLELEPEESPPARSYGTLTYDVSRGRAVLFGGRNNGGYLEDVWEWDGTDWAEIEASGTRPAARSGHGAAYDSERNGVVIVGGVGSTGALNDSWEWSGSFWRQRTTLWNVPAAYNMAMTYDPQHDRLIWFGGQDNNGPVEGTYLHQVLGTPLDAPPIATINRIHPRDARQGVDVITLQGSGADADTSDFIAAYRWKHNGEVVSTQPIFTRAASDFPLGEQTVALEVEDNEGNWSAPVRQTLFIRDGEGGSGGSGRWTQLIYAVADNNLDPWMGDSESLNGMLYRLSTAGAQSNVKVAILYDGPGVNDTRRYILEEDGTWREESLSEARMDEMATLRDFIQWGFNTFDSDYYALSLVNHANGVIGFGQDMSTDSSGRAFLTPIELRSALQAATDDGARKLDVLHYDGCSFGLLEDAAIAAGLVEYTIASPNTGWGVFAYDVYRQRAGSASNPRSYAQAVAQAYAEGVHTHALPYTISVFDMARFDDVNNAVSDLGDSLLSYVQADPPTRKTEIKSVRNMAQKYDSGGLDRLEIDDDDSYLDLVDLASKLEGQISDAAVVSAAQAVSSAIQGSNPFVVYKSHRSGEFDYYDSAIGHNRRYRVQLEETNGLGIYYPPRSTTNSNSIYLKYINNQLFDTTRDSGWTRFLAQGIPPQLSGDPPPMANDALISPLIPNEPVPSGEAILSVTPTTDTVSVSQTFTVALQVRAGEQLVDGVEAYLDFDPNILQVSHVTAGTQLAPVLANTFDNTNGQLHFAAGTLNDFPNGTFTLATITLSAISEAESSSLTFVTTSARQSDVTYGGASILGATENGAFTVLSTILNGSVTLQGRPEAADPRWQVPIQVRLYKSDETTPAYEFTPTTDNNGHFTLYGVQPGVYDAYIKHAHTLQSKQPITLRSGANRIDFGTLREGDADGDNMVRLLDFSILATAFSKCQSTPGYDERADFDGNGCVKMVDFSLLATNFGATGERTPDDPAQRRASRSSLHGKVGLTIEPSHNSLVAGDLFTATIRVEAGKQRVDGVAAYLDFDPTVLQVVGITAGEALPVPIDNQFDNQNGQIHLAAGALEDFPSETFDLAYIQLKAVAANMTPVAAPMPPVGTALRAQERSSTSLRFLFEPPYHTDVTFGGLSVLGGYTNGTISITNKDTTAEEVNTPPILRR